MSAPPMTAEMIATDIPSAMEVDFIEEIRLRTWARKNYAPQQERQQDWHPVILDEMQRIDVEVQ